MNIGIYGSHNSSVSFEENDTFRVIELERYFKKKNCSMMEYEQIPHPTVDELIEFLYFIKNKIGPTIENIYYNQLSIREINLLKDVFIIKRFIKKSHHLGHATSAFYQSPFDKAVIFSYDGGGENEDGSYSSFNIYIGDKDKKEVILYKTINLNLGRAHCHIGIPISEIKKEPNTLQYSGKLMGLSSYGQVVYDWIEPMIDYYNSKNDLSTLSKKIGINLNENSLSGNVSYDLAATSEEVFNVLFLKIYDEEMRNFKGWNVCLTGGCALNVKTNQYVYQTNPFVYIPPNPNDSGLSFGFLHDHFTKNCYDLTYNGLEITDNIELTSYINKFSNNNNPQSVIDSIKEGKIIGILNGNSEVGPRALGNRSIICYPNILNMKNIINSKIKFREWYRPFAPVVRLEDVNKYFNFSSESRFMSFCPTIKLEYKSSLQEIVHIDNTCRIQTVTKDTHSFLYNTLTNMESNGMLPVLLNTSFNIKGNPILSSIKDAFEVLKSTELDGVVIEGHFFKK